MRNLLALGSIASARHLLSCIHAQGLGPVETDYNNCVLLQFKVYASRKALTKKKDAILNFCTHELRLLETFAVVNDCKAAFSWFVSSIESIGQLFRLLFIEDKHRLFFVELFDEAGQFPISCFSFRK
jgi:hypothetical protein